METKTELTPGQKAARTRKLNSNYTPVESGTMNGKILKIALECEPALTDIEVLCLIAMNLTIQRAPACYLNEGSILYGHQGYKWTEQWIWWRAFDFFRRGKYWQSRQDPEALAWKVREAIDNLCNNDYVWFQIGDKSEGHTISLIRFLLRVETGAGEYIFSGLDRVEGQRLRPQREFINYPALVSCWRAYGWEEYLRPRLRVAASRPTLAELQRAAKMIEQQEDSVSITMPTNYNGEQDE